MKSRVVKQKLEFTSK